jgi:hypothetical protein
MSSLLVFKLKGIYRLKIRSVKLVFWALLWTSVPRTFSLVHLPPPPFHVWISTEVCIFTVCSGGGGHRVVLRAYTGVIHSVVDQIPNQQNCFTTQGDLGQINTCRQVLYRSIFKKSRHLGFGVFIGIWSMVFSQHRSLILSKIKGITGYTV